MVRFNIPGRVDHYDILRYYVENNVDCFVHTSESEGGPAVIMEAESAGVPIVATNVGVTSEAIDGNGVLLPVDCIPDGIAEAIKSVLTASDDIRMKMRIRSRAIWENKFDAGKNAREFMEFIGKACGNKKSMIFLTEGFPFRLGEENFFRTELKEMISCYDVTIIARINGKVTEELKRTAWNNLRTIMDSEQAKTSVKIVPYAEKWSFTGSVFSAFKYFADKRTGLERDCIRKSHQRENIRKWESIKYYGKSLKFNEWFEDYLTTAGIDISDTIIYSYWNLEPVLGILLNRDKYPKCGVMSRAHGYDWQDDQWVRSLRKPFAETADELLDYIIFDSKLGRDTYVSRYDFPDYSDKYRFSYFGSVDAMEFCDNDIMSRKSDDPEADKTLRIASCAAMIPLKRINLLIDALGIIKNELPDLSIEWTHFGDGPLREELKAYAYEVLGE